MACARPVVGSDTGGIRYTVVDGETGLLVPPREPVLLADKLEVLARDEALARHMGAAGLRRAKKLFTWDRVGLELARAFDELTGQKEISLSIRELSEGDRKSVVEGKRVSVSVEIGGRRIFKKTK